MNRRSIVFAMIFSSIFGGLVAIVGYSLVAPAKTVIQTVKSDGKGEIAQTNYVFDSSNFIVPDGLNFVFAAKHATPSVVHIRTTYSNGVANNSPFNDFFREYFGERYERDRGGYGQSRGAGSGVIITSDGYVVTNHHVVENASEIEVVLNDNRSYSAEVVGLDKSTDLAVIKIAEEGLPAVTYGDSEKIAVGEWVLAIGNPYEFRSTVTAGIVSAKGRNINILNDAYRIESFIQTDAAVNPGNSGGALVNLNGELVGINTAIASPSGAFAGYSFAVPVTLVEKVVADLIEFGAVQRALLGIRIQDVNAQLAEQENLDILKGVYVVDANADGAASRAGIENGDVIIAVDGKTVNSVAELQEQIAINRPGDDVRVKFLRGGREKEVVATLRNASGTFETVEVVSFFENDGAAFEELNDDELQELKVQGGIKVRSLANGKWKDAGLREGFIITRIDKSEIASISDFRSYLDQKSGDGILIEGIYPDGSKAYYGLGL